MTDTTAVILRPWTAGVIWTVTVKLVNLIWKNSFPHSVEQAVRDQQEDHSIELAMDTHGPTRTTTFIHARQGMNKTPDAFNRDYPIKNPVGLRLLSMSGSLPCGYISLWSLHHCGPEAAELYVCHSLPEADGLQSCDGRCEL